MLDIEKLKEAMGDLEEEDVVAILNKVMDEGGSDAALAMEACQEGMNIVGERFEQGEYFVGDLIYAGELMTEAVGILKPALAADSGQNGGSAGKMILCTVEGDLHDIGKNIVKAMLEAAGFQVTDLGIDVKAEDVVRCAKEQGITIIALSGVLTLALDSMKRTVEKLQEAGMREAVKVIIGGAPVTEESQAYTGADAWATNPQQTVKICREWMECSC